MLQAPLPFCESRRLWALRSLAILDTPSEEVFERLVATASRVLGTPMAALSLVDQDRQWYKASVGLRIRESLRDHAICSHTILSDHPLLVPDLRGDERFALHPAVLKGSQRFYAGVPLVLREGYRVGALCVMDRRSRGFGPEQLATLVDLGALATRLMEMRRDAIGEGRTPDAPTTSRDETPLLTG